MSVTEKNNTCTNVTAWYVFVLIFNALFFLCKCNDIMPYDCPNGCSGIGACRFNTTANVGYHCDCPEGYRAAADCSKRECPKAQYIFSKTRTIAAPHSAVVECSGAGFCNNEGFCECILGFTGNACERNVCPTITEFDCNSRGRCISMYDFSKHEGYGYDLDGDGVGVLYSLWDGPFTHGCVCDWGYLGADCSIINCPKGHDPMLNDTVYHIVTLTTGASSGTLSGTFKVGFYGHFFDLNADASIATASSMEASLESLGNIKNVSVTRGNVNANNGAVYSITFTEWPEKPQENNIYNHNGIPNINFFGCQVYNVVSGTSPTCVWAEVQTATYKNEICSGRGMCDFTVGECTCVDGFFGHNCNRFNYIYEPANQVLSGKIVNVTHSSYTGDAITLETRKPKAKDFSFMSVKVGTTTMVKLKGDGVLKVSKGGMRVTTGNITLQPNIDKRIQHSMNVTSFISVQSTQPNHVLRYYNSKTTYTNSLFEMLGTGTANSYNAIQCNANHTTVFALTGAGEMASYSTYQSTSESTGAVTHAGGLGIGKTLYVGSLVSKITTVATNMLTGSMIAAGGLAVGKKMYVSGAFALTMSTSVRTVYPTLKATSQNMPLSQYDYTVHGSSTQRSGTPLVYFNAKVNTNYTSGRAVTDGSAMIITQTAANSFTGSLLKLSTTVAASSDFEFIHFVTSFNTVNWTYGIAPDANNEKWYRNISGHNAWSIKGDGTMLVGGGIFAEDDSTVTGNIDIGAGGISSSGGNILLSTTSATTITHTGASGGTADLSITSTNGDVVIDNIVIGPSSGLSSAYRGLKTLTSATTLVSTDSYSFVLLDSAAGFALTLPDCTASTIGFNIDLAIKTESSSNGYSIDMSNGSSDIFSGSLFVSDDTAAKTNFIAMVSNANVIYLKAGDGTKPGAVGSNVNIVCMAANTYFVKGNIYSTVDGASGSAQSAAV